MYIKESLENFQLEYLDMYLVHLPFGVFKDDKSEYSDMKRDDGTDHVKIWKVKISLRRLKWNDFSANFLRSLLTLDFFHFHRIKPLHRSDFGWQLEIFSPPSSVVRVYNHSEHVFDASVFVGNGKTSGRWPHEIHRLVEL